MKTSDRSDPDRPGRRRRCSPPSGSLLSRQSARRRRSSATRSPSSRATCPRRSRRRRPARQAQAEYESNFSSLVVLGKAAPADGDTPSLLRQLVDVSAQAKTTFRLAGARHRAPQRRRTPRRRDDHGPERGRRGGSGRGRATRRRRSTAALATEAAAASLPIGASVGSAGLGRTPLRHELHRRLLRDRRPLQGNRRAGRVEEADVDVGGRLITVNSFKMTKEDADQSPRGRAIDLLVRPARVAGPDGGRHFHDAACVGSRSGARRRRRRHEASRAPQAQAQGRRVEFRIEGQAARVRAGPLQGHARPPADHSRDRPPDRDTRRARGPELASRAGGQRPARRRRGS